MSNTSQMYCVPFSQLVSLIRLLAITVPKYIGLTFVEEYLVFHRLSKVFRKNAYDIELVAWTLLMEALLLWMSVLFVYQCHRTGHNRHVVAIDTFRTKYSDFISEMWMNSTHFKHYNTEYEFDSIQYQVDNSMRDSELSGKTKLNKNHKKYYNRNKCLKNQQKWGVGF